MKMSYFFHSWKSSELLDAGNIFTKSFAIRSRKPFDRFRAQISAKMPNRSTRQCRERYNNHLAPIIKKGNWTKEEDALIVRLQLEIGNQWSKIAAQLPGRSDNAVKNRWHLIHRCRPADVAAVNPAINPKQMVLSFSSAPGGSTSIETSSDIPIIGKPPHKSSSFAAAFGFSSSTSDSSAQVGVSSADKSSFSMTNIYRNRMLTEENRRKAAQPKQGSVEGSAGIYLPSSRSVCSSRTGSLQSMNDSFEQPIDLMLLYHNHCEHEHEESVEEYDIFDFPLSALRPSCEGERPSFSSQGTHIRVDSFGFPEWYDGDGSSSIGAALPDFEVPPISSDLFFPTFVPGNNSSSSADSSSKANRTDGHAEHPALGSRSQVASLSSQSDDHNWMDALMNAEINEAISKKLSATSFTNQRTNQIIKKEIGDPISNHDTTVQMPQASQSPKLKSESSLPWDSLSYNFDVGKSSANADLLLAFDERNQMIRAKSARGNKRLDGRHSPATSISDRLSYKKHRMANKVYVLGASSNGPAMMAPPTTSSSSSNISPLRLHGRKESKDFGSFSFSSNQPVNFFRTMLTAKEAPNSPAACEVSSLPNHGSSSAAVIQKLSSKEYLKYPLI